MYFLNTLILLSNTLATAHDEPQSTSAAACTAHNFTSPSTTSSVGLIETVFVTVTHIPPESARSPTTHTLMREDLTPTPASEEDGNDEGAAMSILPISPTRPGDSLPAFDWPSATTATYPSLSQSAPTPHNTDDKKEDKHEDYNGRDDADGAVLADTAWAGTDNAIASQMHDRDRTLPYLSTTSLHLKSAATPRSHRIWRRGGKQSEAEVGVVGRDIGQVDAAWEGDEKSACTPCEEEGLTACRGDVAIGVCRGGCVELQFFGRGRGNGCEDD